MYNPSAPVGSHPSALVLADLVCIDATLRSRTESKEYDPTLFLLHQFNPN